MLSPWDALLPSPVSLAKVAAEMQKDDARDADANLYGAARGAVENRWPAALGVILAVLIFAVLWLWPMIKAFRCGTGETGLGLNGNVWGLLILFMPPLGWIFLFFGSGKCTPQLCTEALRALQKY